jgi:hypothetical protein
MDRVSACFKLIGAAGTLLLSSTCVNAVEVNGNHTAYKLKVTAVISSPTGAFVYFDTNHQCGSKRAYIHGTRVDFDRLYSTLLSAQVSKTSVSIDLRDNVAEGSCNGANSSIGNMCVGDDSGPCFTAW